MSRNSYNIVQFLEKSEYEKYANMTIHPKPDMLIRLFMIFQASDTKIQTGEKIDIFIKENGYLPPYWQLVKFAENSID